MRKWFLCVDLKSFYASVECVQRGLDPLSALLVVADESRTEKTICLAVSPALKAYGIAGRARLFEVIEQVRRANVRRLQSAPERRFTGRSCDARELAADPSLEIGFLIACPQMGKYMEVSSQIYQIYLRYVAPEDIHPYSVDEVFIDLTPYRKTCRTDVESLARTMVHAVLEQTGITATAGIGTNLYLAKVAMDILAKKMPPDENGFRIAWLDEMRYRRELWSHRPLTDFWRVGAGYARKLEKYGMYTMGDIALCSVGEPTQYRNEALLYRLFGINAELLIDHAWGVEPCTMAHIKAYRPSANSISTGQVLSCPYSTENARLIAEEMLDALALDLVQKRLKTNRIELTVGYDRQSLTEGYRGEIATDRYGRAVPKHATGGVDLGQYTASTRRIVEKGLALYDRIIGQGLLVRRLTVAACAVLPQDRVPPRQAEQLSLFAEEAPCDTRSEERERRRQETVLRLKQKYGKNAVLKGMNYRPEATMRERNERIGGHKK